MKSLYYVSTIIRCYRHVLDEYMKNGYIDATEHQYWLDELEKVSHRPYTTGFLFGRPEDNAVNNTSSGYIKPYDFVGVVKAFDATTQIATIEQRNKISVGDTIQFFGTNYKEYDYVVDEMFDEHYQAIDTAPHAQQIIQLKLPFAVEPMDLIRKKID